MCLHVQQIIELPAKTLCNLSPNEFVTCVSITRCLFQVPSYLNINYCLNRSLCIHCQYRRQQVANNYYCLVHLNYWLVHFL